MGDWDRMFGEAGMSDGFIDSFCNEKPNDWVKRMTTRYFKSGEEARRWAKEHPGQAIVRHPDGVGFIANVLEWHDRYSGESYLDCEKEEYFEWAAERTKRKEVVGFAGCCMGLHEYTKAYWLYDNGYKDMLVDLYLEHLGDGYNVDMPPWVFPGVKMPPWDVQREIGTRLSSLLPAPFPENYHRGFD